MAASKLLSPCNSAEQGVVDVAKVQLHVLKGTPSRRYYLYLPKGPDAAANADTRPDQLLIACHGISRNAREHARAFQACARQTNTAILAPHFDADFYRGFQRLGFKGSGGRSDLALNDMLTDVQVLLERDLPLYMFGFSGGGQFVHRYVMAYPERVRAYALAAPGWYTYPDLRQRFPYGLNTQSRLPGLTLNPDEFLKVPVCVLVGLRDFKRDAQLRKTPRVDRQQGANRIIRGHRWLHSMAEAARVRRLNSIFEFQILPRSSHDFEQCVKKDQLDRRVFAFFDRVAPLARHKTDLLNGVEL